MGIWLDFIRSKIRSESHKILLSLFVIYRFKFTHISRCSKHKRRGEEKEKEKEREREREREGGGGGEGESRFYLGFVYEIYAKSGYMKPG